MMTRKDFLRTGAVAVATAALPWREVEAGGDGEVVLPDVTPVSGTGPVVTTCNMCVLGCSVIATREGDRVVRLRGNPESPINRGRLCAKGHAGLFKAVHPERVTHPLVRAGARGSGQWRRVSWTEALRTVARGLGEIKRDFGPRSIALWQNVNMDRPDIFQRFIYALGSPNYIAHTSTCDASRLVGGAMTYGLARARYDYAHAECVLAVGINPLGAKDLVLAARECMEARERGAVWITVDPRLSETAARSDHWLPIRPGTDGVLLAGLAQWLIANNRYDAEFIQRHTFGFDTIRRSLEPYTVEAVCEVTGIPADRFLRTARLLAERRSVVAIGRGVVTHADATDAVRMAEILNALLGAFDREGGVLLMPYPSVPLATLHPRVRKPWGERIDRANAEGIPLPVGLQDDHPAAFFGLSHHVPRAILDEDPYPVRALVFSAVNPVYSLPEGRELIRAFRRLQLVVSIDAFLSETTRFADVVLPASTYLEGMDLWFPLAARVALRQPVIRPVGESRPSQEIILALARTMGLRREFPYRRYEDFVVAQLAGSGVDYRQLQLRSCVPYADAQLRPGRRRRDGFLTPSGRIELTPSLLAAAGRPLEPAFGAWPRVREDHAFPYRLVTYKLPYHTQSATNENPYLAHIQRENPALVNPETAARLGVTDGGEIRIESARGAVTARVRVSAGIRPDTVALSHHFGHTAYSRIATGRGVNANAVIVPATDPIGGNLAFNDTHVRVTRP